MLSPSRLQKFGRPVFARVAAPTSCSSSPNPSPWRTSRCAVHRRYSTNDDKRQQVSKESGEEQKSPIRKGARAPATKTSLRRVAAEAVRSSRPGSQQGNPVTVGADLEVKTVTAYCAAEQYRIEHVARTLSDVGYTIDPYDTNLYPQVVHVQLPSATSTQPKGGDTFGDMFIFPSGTVVAWDIEEEAVTKLITKGLYKASENPHFERMETEDLEFVEDGENDKSSIVGERIVLGTKAPTALGGAATAATTPHTSNFEPIDPELNTASNSSDANLVLAKIAFSSGLARSTKLAVLESALDAYFDSTRTIPTLLSQGKRVPFDRSFILRKTGELFHVRAQLNLYSELTDSLPDLFWDSRHELGLEDYFDRVGKALDVGVRIRTLNQKMDYANEIAAVLRERLSEKHGLLLEWLIIGLIAIEVGFEILSLWKESKERHDPDSLQSLMVRYLRKELEAVGNG